MIWKRIIRWWTVRKVGTALLLLGILIAVTGFLNQHGRLDLGELIGQILGAFYTNVSTDLVSIAITVLIINYLYENSEKQREINRLIGQMNNADKGIAAQAVSDLGSYGWLFDGSLRGRILVVYGANLEGIDFSKADLQGVYLLNTNLRNTDWRWANLQNASLSGSDLNNASMTKINLQNANLVKTNLQGTFLVEADLQRARFLGANLNGASFREANLQGAKITDEQLAKANDLRGAKMPDGSRYNGRFNLRGDMFDLRRFKGIDTKNTKAMGEYYGVSPEEFERGQKWLRTKSRKMHTLPSVADFNKKTPQEVQIEELELSIKLFNSLKRSGITTVGDVIELLERDQKKMSIRNFPKNNIKELRHKLHQMGFLKKT